MKAGEFILRTFHVRTAAHVLHLKSRSYAHHMALHDFYDEIVDLIDNYAETYQGAYGLIDDYAGQYRVYSTPEQMLSEYESYVEDNRAEFYGKGDTHLMNIVDEIQALTRSTLYKLKFLK